MHAFKSRADSYSKSKPISWSKGIFHNVRVVLTCAFQGDERDASYEIIKKKNNNNTVCSNNNINTVITKKNKIKKSITIASATTTDYGTADTLRDDTPQNNKILFILSSMLLFHRL